MALAYTPVGFVNDDFYVKGTLFAGTLDGVAQLQNNFTAIVAPASTDDSVAGYGAGSRWINTVTDAVYTCTDPAASAATWVEVTQTGVSLGEVNTASNTGTGGVGIFKTKTLVDLEFKNINAGSSKVTVTDDTGDNEIDIDVVEANIVHQSISGAGTNTHANIDTHIADGSIHYTQANITTVGIIASGTWNGDAIGDTYISSASTWNAKEPAISSGTTAQYWRGDKTFQILNTSVVTEGSRLYYTDERVDDRAATLIQDGTGISWAYDDGAGTLTPTVSVSSFDSDDISEGITNLYFTDERVDDRAAALIQDGTGLAWTYSDVGNTLTGNISLASFDTGDLSEGSNLYYTDERVDDRAAALIQDGTGLAWTYSDVGNTLTGNISLASFDTDDLSEGSNLYHTDERVDDRVNALIQDGTGLAWTYSDVGNTLTGNISLSSFDTGDLSEGSNLYYTAARVNALVAAYGTAGTVPKFDASGLTDSAIVLDGSDNITGPTGNENLQWGTNKQGLATAGDTNLSYWSHSAQFNSTSYALAQAGTGASTGDTFVNAKTGRSLFLRIANSTIAQMNASGWVDIGTISAGTWQGDVIGDPYISESSVVQHEAAIDHDVLTNFSAGEHRIINDAGTSATELWSASKISGDLAGKAASSHTHATTDIVSGTFANALVAGSNVTQHEAAIDHDALTNFVSGEHFLQSAITTVGTVTSGVWNGTKIDVVRGGTNLAAYAAGDLITATGTTTLASLAKGTADQVVGMNAGATTQEYKSVTGTANRVTVSHGAGSITLSGPQDLATTSDPTFDDLTVDSISSDGGTNFLKVKIVDIGNWNMNVSAAGTNTVNVTHGLTGTSIVRVSGFFWNDTAALPAYPLGGAGSTGTSHDVDGDVCVWIYFWDGSAITLFLRNGCQYDSAAFDDGTINRGKLYIEYIA